MEKVLCLFKKITHLFKQNKSTELLGRWKLEKCINKINRKIDLSNEDHCGNCDQYKKK